MNDSWICVIGPILGSVVAVLFDFILKDGQAKAEAEAAQGIVDGDPAGR